MSNDELRKRFGDAVESFGESVYLRNVRIVPTPVVNAPPGIFGPSTLTEVYEAYKRGAEWAKQLMSKIPVGYEPDLSTLKYEDGKLSVDCRPMEGLQEALNRIMEDVHNES